MWGRLDSLVDLSVSDTQSSIWRVPPPFFGPSLHSRQADQHAQLSRPWKASASSDRGFRVSLLFNLSSADCRESRELQAKFKNKSQNSFVLGKKCKSTRSGNNNNAQSRRPCKQKRRIIPIHPPPLHGSDVPYLTPSCQPARDALMVTISMRDPPHPPHLNNAVVICQTGPSVCVCRRSRVMACVIGVCQGQCIWCAVTDARPRRVRLIEMDACTSKHSGKVSACDG